MFPIPVWLMQLPLRGAGLVAPGPELPPFGSPPVLIRLVLVTLGALGGSFLLGVGLAAGFPEDTDES